MRVLMLTRRVDKDDWLAGFTHTWIERLAAHPAVEAVDVICLTLGAHDLPENVRLWSMGKERGKNRLRELWNFLRGLARFVPTADVIFAHMIPRYLLIAAPWAGVYRKPMVIWYAHRSVTLQLRLAHALAARVVTASPESYNLPGDKVQVIGHGIDMSAFYPADAPPAARTILGVGRLSPIKNYDALLRGLAALRARGGYDDVRVALAGGTTAEYAHHEQTLRDLAQELGLAANVDFLGPVAPDRIPALYRAATLTANLCPTGGLDKVVVESLASGVPAVVHNATYRPLLADDESLLWAETLDPQLIADRLAAVLALDESTRAGLGRRLADRVRAEYALESLIARLVDVFREVLR
jgi:glycosyltransferase involved in cell wall biosynthesis